MKLPAQYAKFITALVGQALVYLQFRYGAGSDWVTGVTAIASALGVLAVPNAPKPVQPTVTTPSVTTTPPPPA